MDKLGRTWRAEAQLVAIHVLQARELQTRVIGG